MSPKEDPSTYPKVVNGEVVEGEVVEGPPRVEYAGVGPRLVAFIVDFIIVIALFFAVIFWGAGVGIIQQTMVPIVMLAVPLVYFTAFWARLGQTPGMMLFRLKVVRPDGIPLGLNGAISRYVLFAGVFFIASTVYALALPLIIALGCYLISIDRQRRGLQDRMANTRVIRGAYPTIGGSLTTLGGVERKQL